MRRADAPSRIRRGLAESVGLRRLGTAALGLMLLAIAWGCSDPQQRYEVLSFFFDGVPPPGMTEADLRQQELNPGVVFVARSDEQKKEQEIVYRYHVPYVKRDCFGCHDQTKGYAAKIDRDSSCVGCHDAYFQVAKADWIHGPVAMGECSMCHEPHRSEHAGLVKAPQPDLCYACHEASHFEADPFHSTLEDKTCTRCHDPHAAGNRLLLVDSRSFNRRSRVNRFNDVLHPVWTASDCVKCHLADQSNAVRPDVNSVCIECHDKAMVDDPVAPLHQAITDGKCTTCHAAHRSPRPSLIRPSAELVCFECHKRDEIRTQTHPNVTHVDCLTCHTGHRRMNPDMLREGVGKPAPTQAQRDPLMELQAQLTAQGVAR